MNALELAAEKCRQLKARLADATVRRERLEVELKAAVLAEDRANSDHLIAWQELSKAIREEFKL